MGKQRSAGTRTSGRPAARRRWTALVLLAFLTLASAFGTVPAAQAEEGVSFYGLYKMVDGVAESHGPYWSEMISITFVEVNEGGGEVRLRVRYSETCSEQYRLRWSFDREITSLRPGEGFTATGTGEATGESCGGTRNAFMTISGLEGSLPSPLIRDVETLGGDATQGSTGRIYARSVPPENLRNSGSARLNVWEHASSEYVAFQLHIHAATPYSLDPLPFTARRQRRPCATISSTFTEQTGKGGCLPLLLLQHRLPLLERPAERAGRALALGPAVQAPAPARDPEALEAVGALASQVTICPSRPLARLSQPWSTAWPSRPVNVALWPATWSTFRSG